MHECWKNLDWTSTKSRERYMRALVAIKDSWFFLSPPFFFRKKLSIKKEEIHRRWTEVWIFDSLIQKGNSFWKRDFLDSLHFATNTIYQYSSDCEWWDIKKLPQIGCWMSRKEETENEGRKKYHESVNLYSNIFLS